MSAREPEPSRRDDLLLMLLHGGAATNSIARHVVDKFAAEVRAEALNEAAADMDAHCEKFGVLGVGDRLRRMAAAPVVPVPDTTGDETELARLRELERRVTEQLEDFEEGLEEDPGAPAVARNMTALLARAVRGESR